MMMNKLKLATCAVLIFGHCCAKMQDGDAMLACKSFGLVAIAYKSFNEICKGVRYFTPDKSHAIKDSDIELASDAYSTFTDKILSPIVYTGACIFLFYTVAPELYKSIKKRLGFKSKETPIRPQAKPLTA